MNMTKYCLFLIIFWGYCLPSYSQTSKVLSELTDSVLYNDSLAAYYGEKGILSKAREYANRNVAINSLYGNKTVPYAISVIKLSKYIPLNEEDEYKSLSEESLAILKDSLGMQSPIYTKYLLGHAWRHYNTNQKQEACNIIKDVAEGGFVSEDPLMGHLYYSYAHFLRDNGETDKAIKYAKKAEAFYENHKLWSEDYYALTLKDLAFLNAQKNDEMIYYLNKARNNIEQYKGRESIEYLNITLDISYAYRGLNKFDKALEYAQFAKGIGEKIKSLDYSSYLYTLEYLSNIYSNMAQYNEAIANAEECLTLMKERKEVAIDERLPTLDSLVVYNWKLSNAEKANLYAKEAYLIRKSSNISGDEMARNLFYLLHSNYYLKKCEDCIKNAKEIQNIYGNLYSSGYKHFFNDMEVLMNSYIKMKLYKEALNVSNEILRTYKKLFGDNTDYYAYSLLNQASIYTYLGDYDKYHDYSLSALGLLKKIYGELSPEYLKELSGIAHVFSNIGFEDSYSLLKKSACLAYEVYGKMHMNFIQNFFNAMVLWANYKDEFLDNYKLDEFYRFLQFQRVICNFNYKKDNLWEKMIPAYELYIQASLPSILQKYNNDSMSIDAIYNSLLLIRAKPSNINEIRSQIRKELGPELEKELDNLYTTNSYYLKSISSDVNPEKNDSLYKQSNKCISALKTKSPTFEIFNNSIITTKLLRNNLKSDEALIDYLCLKQIKDGYTDYIVVIEKNKDCPVFVQVENAPEQIKKICSSYKTSFFIIDSDSIISTLHIDVTKTNCIIGYDLSIEHILNRSQKNQNKSQEPVSQEDYHHNAFTSAYIEFEKGVNLYKKKKYEEAIDAFYSSDSLMSVAKGEKSNYYGHGKHWIASCLHNLGNDTIAKKYSEYYYLSPIDMRQTVLSDSLLDVASNLFNIGNKKEALEKYIEASNIEKSNLGNNNYWYANTISLCAEICNELEEYEIAIDFEKEALKIREKSPGMDHIDYYWSLKNLYHSYSALNIIEEENKYGSRLVDYMEKHKEVLGSELLYYPVFSSALARINVENKQYQEAYSYIMKSINSSELLRDYTPAYLNVYYKAIMGLSLIGNDSLSFELSKKIIPFYEKNTEKLMNPNEYFEILIIAANHYYNQGDYITTSVYQERALDKIRDKSNLLYGMALSNLALTYCELGRIDASVKIAEEAVILTDSILYVEEYAKRLLNLAHCYAVANKPKDALRCGKKCYNVLNANYGLNNHQTLVAGNNLASYYNDLGYHEEAGRLLFTIMKYAEKDEEKNGDVLACIYNNIAMNWHHGKNFDLEESLKYLTKSYEIRKSVLGEFDLYTIQSLYNIGRCLIDLDNISEGIEYIMEALNQTKKIIGEKNLRYIEMMKILPIIYGKIGDLDRALKSAEERYELIKEIVDDNNLSILQCKEDLSELYFYKNDSIKMVKTISESSDRYRRIILSDFPNYTSVERANFVNRMGRYFDWLFPLVCYYNQQSEICSEFYNALLLRKGILLTSEIEFGRLIRESGDSLLIRHYNELLANKNILNRQYQLSEEQRIFNVDSLRHVINEKEDYLISASKEYGDYTKRFRTNWKDVRDKLKDGELSVEFVEFYDTCAIQNRIYYALVINKYSDCPELVPLCMEQQIHKVMKSDDPEGLYQLIWNPILQKSKNVNTIFFSPAGILNNIGIEYVVINEHENISDKYSIYRLSSTREIVDNQENACKTAALYGGLNYSVDTDVLLAQNVRFGVEASSSIIYRGLSDSLSVRNSFEPLYNTKTEIAEIDKTLKKGKVSVSMYSDTFGTEESFKALSGKGMNLIHLATHGMYIGASEAESKKKEINLSFILLDDSGAGQIQEDSSLSRSFLVMSGGDMLPSHKEVPDNLEDGILTASEISKLDLRGLDLVVLSACQTALGDVDNEGVYGLQRGFKKAGANTILMSLDKVDDEATKLLMVEFYKNLMRGKSKHQSLKDAQKYLRQIENGKYDKPEYWASFIMLDGLN